MSMISCRTNRKGAAASSHHAARSRERQALVQLDDEGLRDIGATREQANAEARKPFRK
jgi:uncharacterized protein YjiS (DUF1127 family)